MRHRSATGPVACPRRRSWPSWSGRSPPRIRPVRWRWCASYQERTGERDPLIRTLVHCAGKFQGDAHIFRNARSIIEEYYANSASPRRKDVLFQAWAHFLSFYKKRTLSTDCYELYQHHFGG